MSIFSQYHFNFLKTLSENGVRFIIIGGQAAIYYGVRRGTGDLDLFIEPTTENGRKLLNAFSQLQLQADDVKPEDFEKSIFLGLGFEPDAVDILTVAPGINFKKAYANAGRISDQNLEVKIISLEDLIANKEALNRGETKGLIDRYDVSILKKIQKEREK
ncbi:MAG TPA: nucleotidyltransferase [Cyclobacteriaceae bacterium]|nr:nucleotidyltransferase [Cyclobacteriaceae bacterium]